MPEFKNRLKVSPHPVNPDMWVVESPLHVVYEDGEIIVPVGFETDLASIPRMFWSIVPPMGHYTEAAVVHDFLYRHGVEFTLYGKKATRKAADRLFRDLMKVSGVGFMTRNLLYVGVRIFGSIYTDLP